MFRIFRPAIALMLLVSSFDASAVQPVFPRATGVFVMVVGTGQWVPQGTAMSSSRFSLLSERPPVPRRIWCIPNDNAFQIDGEAPSLALFDNDAHPLWSARQAGLRVVAIDQKVAADGALTFAASKDGQMALWKVDSEGRLARRTASFDFPILPDSKFSPGLESLPCELKALGEGPDIYHLSQRYADQSPSALLLVKPSGDAPAMVGQFDGIIRVFPKTTRLLRNHPKSLRWDLIDLAEPQGKPRIALTASTPPIEVSPLSLLTDPASPLAFELNNITSESVADRVAWVPAANAFLLLDREGQVAKTIDPDGRSEIVPMPSGALRISASQDIVWVAMKGGQVGALRYTAGQWKMLEASPPLWPKKRMAMPDRPPTELTITLTGFPNRALAWASFGEKLVLLEEKGGRVRVKQTVIDNMVSSFVEEGLQPFGNGQWQTPYGRYVLGESPDGSWARIKTAGPNFDQLQANLKFSEVLYPPLGGDIPPEGWLKLNFPPDQIGAYQVQGNHVHFAIRKIPGILGILDYRVSDKRVWLPFANGGLCWADYHVTSPGEPPAIEVSRKMLARHDIRNLIPLSGGEKALIQASNPGFGDEASFLIIDPRITQAKITLGGTNLSAMDTSRQIPLTADQKRGLKVSLDWERRTEALPHHWEIFLEAVDPKDATRLIAKGLQSGEPSEWNQEIFVPLSKELDGPCLISARYKDDAGSEFTVQWPEVTVVPKTQWFESPRVVAVVAWLAVIGLVLFCRVPTMPGIVQRFAPVILGSAASIGGVSALAQHIDLPLFAGLTAFSTLGFIGLGFLQPTVLRLYADIWPLDHVLPSALRIPRLRRRVYASYVARLRRELDEQRAEATHEHYAAVPALLRANGAEQELENPPKDVLDLLSGAPATDVLVTGGGGLGKSALLRAVAEEALLRYETTGHGPLPIFLAGPDKAEGKDDILRQLVAAELLADRLSDKVLAAQLAQGDWFAIIDGLADKGFKADVWARLRGADEIEATRVLAATRSDPEWESEFRTFNNGAIVIPRRLDDRTAQVFQAAYETDPQRWLQPEVLAACRPTGQEGYLPILVRLALKVIRAGEKDRPTTLFEIYKGSIDLLVPEADKIAEARALCLQTYWKNGRRVLAADEPGHAATIEHLLKANVLVAAGRSAATDAVDKVRFFHDSMQSFVTAQAILTDKPAEDAVSPLLRAAGSDIFLRPESAAASGQSPELFRMCLAILEYRDLAAERLTEELLTWADHHAGGFGADRVRKAVPSNQTAGLPTGADTQAILRAAVALFADDSAGLARIYTALAPVVWPMVARSKQA